MFEDIIGKLDSISSSDSNDVVAKNIIQSDASTFNNKNRINPRITSAEKQRLINQTTIFWDTYYKIRGKYEKDTKGETKVATPAARVQKQMQDAKAEAKVQKEGILSKLIGLAGIIGMFGKSILKFLGKQLMKLLAFLGRQVMRGVRFLGRQLKRLVSGLWRNIKRLLSRAWSALKNGVVKLFRRVKNFILGGFKRIGVFIAGVFTGLWNSKPMKAMRSAVNSAVNSIRGIFSKVKDFLMSKLKAVGNFFGNILSKIPGVSKLFPKLASSAAGAAGAARAAKSGGVWNSIKSFGKGVVSGAADLGQRAWSGVKTVGTAAVELGKKGVQGAAKVGSAVYNTAKNIVTYPVNKAKDIISGKFKVLLKSFGGPVKLLTWLAKKIPIFNGIVEALFARSDIRGYKERYQQGDITLDQLHMLAGGRAIKGATSAIGTAAGGFLGGLAGLFGGPVGSAIGSIVGALGGQQLGEFAGGLLTKYVIPPSATKKIGAFFTGDMPVMQDFIIQRGNVIPFSSQDQVLGMKTGGAIDQLVKAATNPPINGGEIGKWMDNNYKSIFNKTAPSNSIQGVAGMSELKNIITQKVSSTLTSLNQVAIPATISGAVNSPANNGIREEITKSNYYLKKLVDLVATSNNLLSKTSRGGSTVVPGNTERAISEPPPGTDSRGDYFNSPYSINVPSVG